MYRARDTRLNRDVAIKVLPDLFAGDAERLARFTREAQTLAALNHPGIAAIYGIEELPSGRALVMELVTGEDLSAVIARGPMPPNEALPVARQIAEALETAHELGIVHRDLKPANIKVRPDGTVKVLDFGLAKAMDPSAPSSSDAMNSPTLTVRATQLGMVIGTAAYMAPEQARGKAVDRRADIWAFGVVLYEMLTGRRAFDGEEISDVLAAVLTRDPDLSALPAATPAAMRRLLERCLVKDPKRRLRDIGEARLILEGQDAPLSTVAAAPASPPRRLWPIAIAIVAVIAIAGGAGRLTGRRDDPPLARLSIALPPGDQVTTVPAISPDGQTIAYPAGPDEDDVATLPAKPRRRDASRGGFERRSAPIHFSHPTAGSSRSSRVAISGAPLSPVAPRPSSRPRLFRGAARGARTDRSSSSPPSIRASGRCRPTAAARSK